MKLKDLCGYLDSAVPLSFQESYDNSGLQAGDPDDELKCGLLAIDVTEAVVDEAISKACNLIISHHPVLFGGVKKITPANTVGRILLKCIKNDIAVYSAHTSLDISNSGVSRKMAEKLGLINIATLQPLEKQLLKLVTYIPVSHLDKVRSAVFEAGAGVIGNYDNCGFTVQGKGSFKGNENTNPFAGKKNELHFEDEVRFETVLYSYLKDNVIAALLRSHPYEEVAYDLYGLENNNIDAGLGCTGDLETETDEKTFLEKVAEVFGSGGIRYSKLLGKPIRKVSMCGGAGSSLLHRAISSGSDAFITGDTRYHTYFEAEDRILLIDAGHYETEKFATELLNELIIKKFPKFALRFSEISTNPINYL